MAQLVVALGLAIVAASLLYRPAVCLLTAAICVVPIYWVPEPGILTVAPSPMVGAGLVILPAALLRGVRTRPGSIDVLVTAYFVGLVISYLVAYQSGGLLTFQLMLTTVLPYAAFRLVLSESRLRHDLAVTVLASAAFLAGVAIYERLSGRNPFHEWRTPGYLADIWTAETYRFGDLRAAASLGQPLILGTFLAAVFILGVHYVVTTRGAVRLVLVGVQVLILAGILATLSRGPLLMMAVGTFLYLASMRSNRTVAFFVVALAAAGAYYLTPLGQYVTELVTSITSGDASANVDYRATLFDLMLDPGLFSLFGRGIGGDFYSVESTANLTSIDSHYVLTYLRSGLIPTIAFALIAVPVLRATRDAADSLSRAWAASVVATFVGVVSVALLLQQADLFWLSVAAVAAAVSDRQSVDGEGIPDPQASVEQDAPSNSPTSPGVPPRQLRGRARPTEMQPRRRTREPLHHHGSG